MEEGGRKEGGEGEREVEIDPYVLEKGGGQQNQSSPFLSLDV